VSAARFAGSCAPRARPALGMLLGLSVILGGCSSIDLSGLSGPSNFKCKAPDGVSCMSVSGLYANASQGNLPAMKRTPADELLRLQGPEATPGAAAPGWGSATAAAPAQATAEGGLASQAAQPPRTPSPTRAAPQPQQQQAPSGPQLASPAQMEALSSGQPLRQGPKVLRVWVAPMEDTDGQLHDQRYVFAVVDQGRWAIEVNRANIQRQFRPVYQLGRREDAERPAEASTDASGAQRGRQPSQRAVESVQRSGGTLPAGVVNRSEGD